MMLTAIAEPKAPTGVGSGALLGIWYLLLGAVILVSIIIWVMTSSFYYKHYRKYHQNRCENNQNPSKPKKPTSEIDECVCLLLRFCADFDCSSAIIT
jgi:hypothetical protein